ncbi:hypothetical protein B0O80DRAFT_502538 [Mortierella sp. GBAus27b]|nr:hypothetical protein B0O80DRAFT_502538 [Mortierella sp. GBAus27b]
MERMQLEYGTHPRHRRGENSNSKTKHCAASALLNFDLGMQVGKWSRPSPIGIQTTHVDSYCHGEDAMKIQRTSTQPSWRECQLQGKALCFQGTMPNLDLEQMGKRPRSPRIQKQNTHIDSERHEWGIGVNDMNTTIVEEAHIGPVSISKILS